MSEYIPRPRAGASSTVGWSPTPRSGAICIASRSCAAPATPATAGATTTSTSNCCCGALRRRRHDRDPAPAALPHAGRLQHDLPGRQGRLGPALSRLAANREVRILFRCGGCKWEKLVTPRQAIAQLTAAKTGAAATLHTDLITKITKPCPKCAATTWTCDVRWPTAPKDKTYAQRHLEDRAAERVVKGRDG
uniref:Uncharacterized protein n=1 Tax=Phenylobacterium glaciei TaxID=2803784 RepID=A0A974P5Y6_9CAUL|nr:hypothetical protein JKL49_07135 [Phenylobacterium glaciei]